MKVLDRLKTGLVLTKDSVLVMRHNPRLALFPIVSGIAAAAFLATFLGITFGFLLADFSFAGADTANLIVLALGIGIIYLGTTFISAFFTAGLVHQTRAVLSGEESSLRAGMSGAWERKWPLLAWALISATVGVILNAIADSNSTVGQTLSAIFGIAWTLMTFFIIPVIVFEKTSIRGMFTRSAGTFKDTWGETPISLGGLTLISMAAGLPFIVPGGYLLFGASVGATLQVLGAVLFVGGILLVTLVNHTLRGIVKTTLYFYSTEGIQPEEFDNVDFDQLSKDDESSASTPVGATSGGFR